MGQFRTFKCNKCGYSVVSSGGKDYGMFVVTDTYICKSCNNIVDVTVGELGIHIPKEIVSSLIKDDKDRYKDFYKCPECGEENNLVRWKNRKRPCPKCDGKMEVDESAGIMMWD